nr:MAG TPA: Heat shock factor-binding protein 1 helix, Nucleus, TRANSCRIPTION.8A [Caudoviricetes sp.]
MHNILQYSPIIVVVIMYLTQLRIVVTPEQLEKKHREILDDIENKFATQNSVKDLKEQMGDMKEKIDRIYECIIAVK